MVTDKDASADYLRDQRIAFEHGIPPPDFPGGEGESKFDARFTPDDDKVSTARRVLGLDVLPNPKGKELIKKANEILFS
jgi:hypothetical protein